MSTRKEVDNPIPRIRWAIYDQILGALRAASDGAGISQDDRWAFFRARGYRTRVPLLRLTSAQGTLHPERLAWAAAATTVPDDPYPPIVIAWRGWYAVYDGNHRAAAALMCGTSAIDALLVPLGDVL